MHCITFNIYDVFPGIPPHWCHHIGSEMLKPYQFWHGLDSMALQWRHNERDASQITSLPIVYSIAYSRRRSKKHQSSASLAFMRGIHRWQVTRKMFPFDDVSWVPQMFCLNMQTDTELFTTPNPWRPRRCDEILSVGTLKQNIGSTSLGLTNINSN